MLTMFNRFSLQRYEFLCKQPNKNAKICRILHFLYNYAMFPPTIYQLSALPRSSVMFALKNIFSHQKIIYIYKQYTILILIMRTMITYNHNLLKRVVYSSKRL